ncbi:MAG: hypothetical protein JNK48_12810 [Bryobacterales bacterium]|nr:hypothetical protein [Bryobacterales bacterium]
MSKYEVSKTVEAVKLNKRTGAPLGEPPISLPFGAIIDKLEEAGDFYTFTYMAERYRMRQDNVRGALHPIGAPASSSVPKPAAEVGKAEPPPPPLVFEKLQSASAVSRAKVPGGWLVIHGTGIAFVPDAGHEWDGASLP